MIIPVDETNLFQAAAIHSVSWKESHRAFCDPDFLEKHSPDRQREYMRNKMENGTKLLLYAVSQCTDIPTLWILENNINAERLYRRMGFRETGNRNNITEGLDEIEFALTNRQEEK